MADLIQSIQDMLKEETWTRATISNYTQNNLKELANIVEQARNENCIKDIQAVCTEHLTHSKDSIIALYICGILDLQKGSIDNSNLMTLVDIFQKNHKENIVTYLCESILEDDPSNRFALRTLAQSYLAENNEKVWGLYEKIVKIDIEEANLAKVLAEHYENAGNRENAINYYKKSIIRFINNGNYNAVKEVWTKLVQFIPEKIETFQMIRSKIAKMMGEIKTTILMQELYDWYEKNKKWDTAIMILKQNLEIDPKDDWARKKITECFRQKYAKHARLKEYIDASNLEKNYRDVFVAINDFEKHIAFDKGNYIFHRNWGVGVIGKQDKDNLYIYFGRKDDPRQMKLSMAVTALKPLSKDHIWVKKATMKKDVLSAEIKKDPAKALEIIIKSFDNNCDFKRIKAELYIPDNPNASILKQGEWTSWSAKAKKELATNPKFGVNPNDNSMYIVRDGEITLGEKLSSEFKAQKQFFARVDILMKYFEEDETDNSSELFTEMYSYFTGFLNNISKVTEQVLASYLIVKHISAIDKNLAYPVKETFAEIYNRIEDPREIYTRLKDSKNTNLREEFLAAIKMLPDWNVQYIKLFPTVLNEKLLKELIDNGYTEDLQKFARTAFDMYKDYRETVLFFFEKCREKEWYKNADISLDKQIITIINIIELTFREINNHVNSTENKKINKNATSLLFDNPDVFEYMFGGSEDFVKKMYTLIDDIVDFDPSYKSDARNKILSKYPDFKFRVASEEKSLQPKGMVVTSKKLAEKKAEIDNIKNVELENNKKDLADAKAKGDLKENAEYQAAKERKHYLEHTLAKLTEELNRAVIFDPTTSTTSFVSFATVVTMHNNIDNKDEVFTILGPWESDPENNVISYMSPFGNAILDKKVGDNVKFTINEHKYDYTIKNIAKAKNI